MTSRLSMNYNYGEYRHYGNNFRGRGYNRGRGRGMRRGRGKYVRF